MRNKDATFKFYDDSNLGSIEVVDYENLGEEDDNAIAAGKSGPESPRANATKVRGRGRSPVQPS